EVLPKIETPDLSKIKLEKLVAKADAASINAVMQRLLRENKQFADAPAAAAAATGEAVVIDFQGRVGGKPFEGAEAENFQLELGSNAFIPGFEAGLVGVKAGETRTLKVTFPKDYRMKGVAGKEAEFEVKVRAVKRRVEQKADDAFAKALGFENLKALTENITRQIEAENAALSRAYLKRRLLDHLAAEVKFAAPATLVEREYRQIWERIKQDMLMHGEATADQLNTLAEPADAKERKEYRDIAERRVRLALLMSEIGRELDVKVTPEEVNQQIMFEAQRNPGHEREVLEFFKKNPEAYESAQAPVYEEKVVDIVLSKITTTEKALTPDALRAAFENLDTEEEAPAVKSAAPEAKTPAKKAVPAKAAKTPAKTAAPKKAAAKKKKK
ncbi:MAG TPA: trigger factor, partial [Sphingomonadales bacterium]|nr:trigger factor [Sphingomonadales bacterium]